jgi:hypothetical protein
MAKNSPARVQDRAHLRRELVELERLEQQLHGARRGERANLQREFAIFAEFPAAAAPLSDQHRRSLRELEQAMETAGLIPQAGAEGGSVAPAAASEFVSGREYPATPQSQHSAALSQLEEAMRAAGLRVPSQSPGLQPTSVAPLQFEPAARRDLQSELQQLEKFLDELGERGVAAPSAATKPLPPAGRQAAPRDQPVEEIEESRRRRDKRPRGR